MSAIATTIPTGRRNSLGRTTVVGGLGAAAATAAAAASVHAAGVPLAVDHQMIPIAGFAQLTFVGAVLGGLIAAGLKRLSSSPRRRFFEITAVLTALSCVPSVALPPDVATKLSLVTLHVLAAAIIVPVLARRLAD